MASRWAANEISTLRTQLDNLHQMYASLMQERDELIKEREANDRQTAKEPEPISGTDPQ